VEDMCLEQVCGAGVWRVTVWSWSEAGVVWARALYKWHLTSPSARTWVWLC